MIKVFIVVLFSFLYSCETGKKTVETTAFSSSNSDKIPDNKIWDMDVNITSEGKLKGKLKAGYVERDNFGGSKYTVSRIYSGLIIDFFDNGKNTGNLISDKGNINDLSEIFTAIDNVVFKSDKGYTLYTDTLIWNRKNETIYTDSKIIMIKDSRDTLFGEGFITDDKFESYQIRKP
ncbi:MAG: LPS export ABC transporter periplasmic protein LptC, partial [Candidatus Delongbacteria bacterium]|nr:LPS export ABC transporter periplasmic protein LptC [Candidatus Delongbacteria bacterium]